MMTGTCMPLPPHRSLRKQGLSVSTLAGRAVESESEGNLGGVGVGKNVPTPTSI
jgi:hypothetical protein